MKTINRRAFLKQSAFITACAALPTLSILEGCSQSEESGNTNKDKQLKLLTMQAAWVNDAEFTGYFVAIENGYYKEEGINLKYLSGGPEVIPEASLLSGKADVALTTPDTTVNLILKDKAPLKIIGAQYQKSPLGIVSLKESGIHKPSDLVGKTLAVPPVNILSIKALFRLNNIKEDTVKIVPYQYDPSPLINKQVDATVDFTTNVPYSIRLAGANPESFLMYDFGFTIYNDTVVVTEKTLRDKKEELISWLRASRKGWIENFKNHEKYPRQFMGSFFSGNGRTVENEIYFNNAQRPLMETSNGIFTMSSEGIEANIKALASIGLVATKDMFVTDLLDEV